MFLLCSCVVVPVSESSIDEATSSNLSEDSDHNSINSDTSSNEETYSSAEVSSIEDNSSSEITISEEVKVKYYKLFDDVSVDILPTILDDETDIHFSYEGGKLYYRFFESGEYQEIQSTKPLKIPYIKSNNIDDYPLTKMVDPDPTGTMGADKLYSSDYVSNIYNTNNYRLSQKMPVLYLKFVKDDESVIERVFTYPIEKDFDLSSIPVVCVNGYQSSFSPTEKSTWFYNRITEDLKKRAYIEYFDKEYDEYFLRDTQIKVGGNWSKGYPQRTLNLNFSKDSSGAKNDTVTAHIFKETTKQNSETERINKLSRFRLFNGGNCFEERTGYNDVMMHMMMRGTNVATTAYRPCIVFLNGEYWGIMSIREHYSDTYFKDNYDVKKDNVVLYQYQGGWSFDDGDETNAQTYLDELLNYVDTHDFTDDDVYNEFINNYIDIDSFIDLFIVESYAANWDFVGNYNNLKMWRVSTIDNKNPYADGKWRFCLHDIDFACDGSNSTVFLSNSDINDPNFQHHYRRFPMYDKLARNKNFRMRFIARAQELIASNLSAENTNKVLDDIIDEIIDYKIESQIRWGKNNSYRTTLLNNVNDTKVWMANRSDEYLGRLNSSLSTWGEIA